MKKFRRAMRYTGDVSEFNEFYAYALRVHRLWPELPLKHLYHLVEVCGHATWECLIKNLEMSRRWEG